MIFFAKLRARNIARFNIEMMSAEAFIRDILKWGPKVAGRYSKYHCMIGGVDYTGDITYVFIIYTLCIH